MAQGKTRFALGVLLVVLGVVWGASVQKEHLLESAEGPELGSSGAAGSLVLLTSIVAALGALLIVLGISHAPWRPRLRAAVIIAGAAWLALILTQVDFPNYTALPESRTADISQNHFLLEAEGAASVLTPLLALLAGILVVVAATARRLMVPGNETLAQAVRSHQAAVAFAAPFLLVTAIGNITLLVHVPPGAGLALVLLPLVAAACVALVVTWMVRQQALGRWCADHRFSPVASEISRGADRVQWACLAVMGLAGAAATMLPATDLPQTSLGRTLVLTLRSHGQGVLFLILPILPVLHMQGRVRAFHVEETGDVPVASWPLFVAIIAGGLLGAVGAASGSALLPWILGLAPLAAWTLWRAPRWAAIGAPLLLAACLWARGDTIIASYDANAFPAITFATAPGILALWRSLAVAVVAVALYRAVSDLPGRLSVRVPAALGIAVGIALFVVLEVPLAIWHDSDAGGGVVAVGSLVASQSGAVQAVMHALATAGMAGAATAFARLARPDWFRRRRAAADAKPQSA